MNHTAGLSTLAWVVIVSLAVSTSLWMLPDIIYIVRENKRTQHKVLNMLMKLLVFMFVLTAIAIFFEEI